MRALVHALGVGNGAGARCPFEAVANQGRLPTRCPAGFGVRELNEKACRAPMKILIEAAAVADRPRRLSMGKRVFSLTHLRKRRLRRPLRSFS